MTPALYIALILAAMDAACIWLLFFINQRERDAACADFDWHKCSWCQSYGLTTYFNQRTGVRCSVKPPFAPLIDSHGLCPSCAERELAKLKEMKP